MSRDDAGQHLIILFRPTLTLSMSPSDPGDSFSEGGRTYRTMIDSDMTGFYDRLVDERGRLVGVQVALLVGEKTLPTTLARIPYVESGGGGTITIRIYFTNAPRTRIRAIDDQAFGGRVYEAADGEFALSMNTDWMSEADLSAIRASKANWISIFGGP